MKSTFCMRVWGATELDIDIIEIVYRDNSHCNECIISENFKWLTLIITKRTVLDIRFWADPNWCIAVLRLICSCQWLNDYRVEILVLNNQAAWAFPCLGNLLNKVNTTIPTNTECMNPTVLFVCRSLCKLDDFIRWADLAISEQEYFLDTPWSCSTHFLYYAL